MEPIVSSETSAIRTQMPGNYPKRNKLQWNQTLRNQKFQLPPKLFSKIKTETNYLKTRFVLLLNVFQPLLKKTKILENMNT